MYHTHHLLQLHAFIALKVTSGFELYCAFGPLTTKAAAIAAVNRLLQWIKHEEEKLFILSSQLW